MAKLSAFASYFAWSHFSRCRCREHECEMWINVGGGKTLVAHQFYFLWVAEAKRIRLRKFQIRLLIHFYASFYVSHIISDYAQITVKSRIIPSHTNPNTFTRHHHCRRHHQAEENRNPLQTCKQVERLLRSSSLPTGIVVAVRSSWGQVTVSPDSAIFTIYLH